MALKIDIEEGMPLWYKALVGFLRELRALNNPQVSLLLKKYRITILGEG